MKTILQQVSLATLLALLSAQAVLGQELVRSGLCRESDFDKTSRECRAGHLLRGEGIVLNYPGIWGICLLSDYRTSEKAELTHVWHFNGTRMPQERPTVWREDTRSLLENVSAELEWLKNKEKIGLVSTIASVVKLVLAPSERYRTWSCKALAPEWAGPWKAQIYDARSAAPLATYEFKLE